MRRLIPLLLLVTALFLPGMVVAQTCSTSWVNPAGGNWNTASNWSSGLPSSTSNVCIDLGGTYTVTLTGSVTINSLSLGNAAGEDGQTLELNGTLTLGAASTVRPTGRIEWVSGSIQGAGALAIDGFLRLSGPATKDVRNVITNRATAEIAGAVRLVNGGQFVNAETGLLTFAGDDDVTQFNNSTLVNHGTLVKNGGADETTISSQFTNTGSVEVQTGTLRLIHTMTLTGGTYTASGEAALLFDADAYATGTLAGAPAGTVAFVNDWFYADGAEARLDFGGTGFEWRSGSFSQRNGGAWFNDGLLEIAGTGGANGRDVRVTFTNTATTRVVSGFRLVNGGEFVNAEGGHLAFDGDVNVAQFNNSTLTNHGTFVKRSEGVATITSLFANTGAVDVQGGTLRLNGGRATLTGGTYDVVAGDTLAFRTDTYVTGTLSGAPAGTLVMEGNTFYADGTEAVLDFSGTGFRWLAGTFRSGGGTWRNDGTLTLATATGKDLYDTFTNTGSVALNGPMRLLNGAQFVNAEGGRFEVEGTQTVSQYNASTFVNAGLLTVSGDTLTVNAGFQHRATGTLAGDGLLALTSSATHGTIAPGDLTWTRALSMDSSSARLDVEIGGTEAGTQYGRLRVLNPATLQGTLRVNLTNDFVPQEGDAFSVLTASSITGLFDTFDGLTSTAGNVSLYPAVGDTAVTLLARAGVPTASGPLAITPASTVNGHLTTVVLTGTGFAPDATVTLVCSDCAEPGQFGTIRGRVRQMTPTSAVVQFDLRDPFIMGLYDVVLEDPRGGRVSTPLAIGSGGVAAVRVIPLNLDASELGPQAGSFDVQLSAPMSEPVTVNFTLGGTAVRFQDYVLTGHGLSVTIPAGKTRATVSVLPLPDLVADDGETVTITLEPSNAYELAGQVSAEIIIADGPAPTDFVVHNVSPDRAGNNGTLIMTVAGQAITPGATGRLTGGINKEADFAAVNDGGTLLRLLFDVTGAAEGAQLDLVVTNGNGETTTIQDALTIEEFVAPEISVQVVGPSTFRSFLPPQRYVAMVTNRGNVDAIAVPVFLSVRKSGNPYIAPDFKVHYLDPTEIEGMPPDFPGWGNLELVEDWGDRLVLAVTIPVLQAGETVSLPFMARSYNIKVWTTPTSQPFVQDSSPILRGMPVASNGMNYAWSGMSIADIAMAADAAVDPDQLAKCMTSVASAVASSIPGVGCLQNLSKLGVTTFANVAKVGMSPQDGTRAAFASSSIVYGLGAAAYACLKDAAKLNPWGLAFGVGLGLYGVYKDCKPLFDEPPGDGDDVDEIRAVDPNDKLGPNGAGAAHYTAGIDAAGYQIRFENDTTATAPAVLVSVTDQLDVAKFDLSTFALGTIAFGDTSVTPPPGLKQWTTTVELPDEDRFVVRIIAGLNEETGLVTWQLMAVDPQTGEFPSDATAGFLPPNVTKPEGEGSLFFTINPKAGLPSGTQLCNEARIVFDVNEPIDTPPWCNTLDFVDPVSQMEALDAVQTDTSFTVAWSGTDETSGVSEYLVYVSTNDGPFTLWQVTNETSATFDGAADSTYAFYTVARDGARNLEAKEEIAETVTRVDPTSVAVEDDTLPTEFALNANTPNPFGDRTRIRYALPEAAHVRLEVFDMLGRRVALLVDEAKAPGYHVADWGAASGLSSGLYFIRLHAGRYIEVREATLVR